MVAPPKSNVYAQLARLKRAAEEALAELEATRAYVQDLEFRVRQRDEAITQMRGENSSLRHALDIRSSVSPEVESSTA